MHKYIFLLLIFNISCCKAQVYSYSNNYNYSYQNYRPYYYFYYQRPKSKYERLMEKQANAQAYWSLKALNEQNRLTYLDKVERGIQNQRRALDLAREKYELEQEKKEFRRKKLDKS